MPVVKNPGYPAHRCHPSPPVNAPLQMNGHTPGEFPTTMPHALRPLLVLLLTMPLLLTGCSSPRTSDRDIVFVGNSEAQAALEPRSRVLRLGGESKRGIFVDPRSRREFIAGHIPGAIHMPMENLRARSEELREWEPLIVYGPDATSPLAVAASKVLLELGHRDVRTLRGGLRAWKEEGNAVATGDGGR